MDTIKDTIVQFSGLKCGSYDYTFELGNDFFAAFKNENLNAGEVVFQVKLEKMENLLVFHFDFQGKVSTVCDRCLDDMEQQIETTDEMSVVEDDTEDGVVDISWWLYENMVLNIPIQHVHDTGKCNVAMLKVLEEHSATRSSDKDEDNVNPMWAKLQGLKEKLN